MKSKTKLSVVIPIHNEEDNIKPLKKSLEKVLKDFSWFEIIWVDDGSSDGSMAVLETIAEKNSSHKVVQLRRNFGQTAALSAGFAQAQGDVVVTLDGDLQNDPKDIPKLLNYIDQGYDLVSGWRKNRQDESVRTTFSKVANKLINRITNVDIHDSGCTLKAYRGDLVKELRLYGEMHRFIPAIASHIGAKIIEVPVNHHPRKHGKSKYGLGRTFRVLLDLILIKFLLSFQNRPLHLFGGLGILSSLSGLLIGGYLVWGKLFWGFALSNRPLFLVSIWLVLIGIQFITFGILSEILMRVYYESQAKTPYYIRKILNKP